MDSPCSALMRRWCPRLRGGAGLPMTETVGALCALGSALSWSVTSLMVSALAPGIGSFTINAARTTLTSAIIVGWMLVAGGLQSILTLSMGNLALLAVSIVFAIAIGDTIFFESAQRLGLGRAMTISMSYPIVAASLAALLLGERLTAPIVVGGLLTLTGVVFLGERLPTLALLGVVVTVAGIAVLRF